MTAKAEIGFFSFTEVTDPSEHASYNEWHQLDHLPEQYVLPGVAHGQRWVCTPECKAARVVDGELLGPVHYMTLYLMTAPVAETLEGFRALAVTLHEADRFHEHRRAHLSGPFDIIDARVSPHALVSPEVLPVRPNLGAYVIVQAHQNEGAPTPWPADSDMREELLEQTGVAGVWVFVSNLGFEHLRWRPGDRRITVCFLDQPPLDMSPALGNVAKARAHEGGAVTELAGPFETIAPWQWDWFDS